MSEPIGVCVLIINPHDHKVLLGKRKNAYKAGYYGLPGGHLEGDETLISCAEREVKEETGLQHLDLEYIGTVRDLQHGQTGDYSFIHFAFMTDSYQGQPVTVEPDKCEGWEWFSLTNLPNKILPGHLAAIDMYVQSNTLTLRDLV